MFELQFKRSTHVNGTPKEYDDFADKAWTEEVGFIGHMLSPNEYMTLDKIMEECSEYSQSMDENNPYEGNKEKVLNELIALIVLDMVDVKISMF